MGWQEIKEALCASRDFKQVRDGYSVLADTMMPSGMLIRVHIQLRDGLLFLHDNGAAFDEIACHGVECRNPSPVRAMLSETRFRLTPEGQIFRDAVKPDDVGAGVSMIADASLRAAQYMLAHNKARIGKPLDVRVREALRLRFPDGMVQYRFVGQSRQQTFDYGFEYDQQTILVDAVQPDLSSVNSAIVKSLDALRAPNGRARPILIYDEADHWPSDMLNLLGMAGERVSYKRIEQGRLLAA